MGRREERTVGERGQVTLPKELREKLGIRGGDEVLVHEEDGKITIEKPVSREEVAEGYRRRAAESEALAEEMAEASREANEYLDDAPEW
ncbi:AbrB family transcriptional regulator [Halorubrum californiense DSM 19288]|uniref:AbrB family transcriptional regulator n=1 Tax=Halorubrum californiense DSM 19288 TaxID=1227465 RepID=M0EFS4_9EURY|nr:MULTISPECIES: AbrB/MazE/SpoVT family DNA-binding domain-containing protein [Halorubrum]ELZ45923.1 AbrB family transcriptional regulator [Halorubrum californiense DSM 19288]TKX72322.1 AbrB/MazE/SpoVT family DNA-binding domain-containing protein [Halorubrum sp. GN11GM_10-3_MGM]